MSTVLVTILCAFEDFKGLCYAVFVFNIDSGVVFVLAIGIYVTGTILDGPINFWFGPA